MVNRHVAYARSIVMLACLFAPPPAAWARAPGHEPQIWLSAIEPPWRKIWRFPPNDFLDLFHAGAPWDEASRRVGVFELTKCFVLESPDDVLRPVLADLARRHIALSMQLTPLIATRTCGLGVEGFGPPDDALRAARRIRQMGGVLAYASMDEPLWYGHAWPGTLALHACKLPVAELVREVAAKLGDLRRVFPSVVVGAVEPVGVAQGGWPDLMVTWLSALAQAPETRIGFVHFDIVWRSPLWESQFDSLRLVPFTTRIRATTVIKAGSRRPKRTICS